MKVTIIEISPEEVLELLGDNDTEIDWNAPSTKEIRQWARSNGLAVASQGALPRDVIETFYRETVTRHA